MNAQETNHGTTGQVCGLDGCTAPTKAHGWCHRHYQRWLRHGDPLTVHPPGRPLQSVEELFWSRVDLSGPVPDAWPQLGPCWLWTGARRGGRGAFNLPATATCPRRVMPAHRWAYEHLVGPVPGRLELDHLCHAVALDWCPGGPTCPHRRCVNPDHLLLVARLPAPRAMVARRAGPGRCAAGHRYDRVDAHGRRRCGTCMRDHIAARYAATVGLPTREAEQARIATWLHHHTDASTAAPASQPSQLDRTHHNQQQHQQAARRPSP